jgi:hypothetical protein
MRQLFQFSEHSLLMFKEREIKKSWIELTLKNPQEKILNQEDGTIHFIKTIEEFGNRNLRIIVNPDFKPQKIVTLFFDRRIKRR